MVCIAACHLSFFIGSYEILVAFAMELEQDFHLLIQQPDENRTELKNKLSVFVQFHCSAKRLRVNFLWMFTFSVQFHELTIVITISGESENLVMYSN